MTTYKLFIASLTLGLLISMTKPYDRHSSEKANASIKGEISIATKENYLKAKLSYLYPVNDDALDSLSFFLAPELRIEAVEGENIKGHRFDTQAKPFSTLRIYFKGRIQKGKHTKFAISYSGRPSKGFWSEQYSWIDLDPDFMILPLFSTLENFTYHIRTSVDNKEFSFYDLNSGEISSKLLLTSKTPSYYFNSILLGNNGVNGMKLHHLRRKQYLVNVFTPKSDSAGYVADAASRILDFYNSTFARKDTINSFSILYRPTPYELHRVTRTYDRSIIFAKPHNETGTLAHEIAHFWWHRGSALTTEKWLHESFAEYSQLMFFRHEQGEKKFEEAVAHLAEQSQKLPALLGTDRFSPHGFDLIYVKGPYLLYQLEKQVGREKFIEFLIELNEKKIDTTQNLLSVLEKISSPQISKEFEEKLRI